MAYVYEPGRFIDLAETPLGLDLWSFLNEPDNVLRMETASELRCPAVEPLAERLVARFGEPVRAHRVKQMIGHMARQVMRRRGFALDRQGVRVRTGDLFSRGSCYQRWETGEAS